MALLGTNFRAGRGVLPPGLASADWPIDVWCHVRDSVCDGTVETAGPGVRWEIGRTFLGLYLCQVQYGSIAYE